MFLRSLSFFGVKSVGVKNLDFFPQVFLMAILIEIPHSVIIV